ncbi:MAG TPA: peptidoglycan DD-metalloendopeptidase family protein [Parafilimonas sp.]|nr:peptidoglycan DD-metalloendopeptidase family protein [Parafilimonas sp.]
MKKYLCFFILIFVEGCFLKAHAQKTYPQNYFRDPLNIAIQLASNFGELRTDHFHMGLDIRTQSRENLPVFAAADGYVSRIKIEKYGYGQAIYITHPNGYTTLYAHLNSFYDALEKYVEDKQYKDESWEQDFTLPKDLFHVTKGQFIANSGNTGGSQGPHLHFEIRDTKTGNNLNPLLFGLPVPDTKPPLLFGLYWFDRRYSVYNVQPQQISITHKNNIYKTSSGVVKVGSPVITLGFRAEDVSNNSPFKFGVYHAALSMDDSLLFECKLNDFLYDDSRYVNACMDYGEWVSHHVGIQYLSILPGNHLNIFTPLESDGTILLNDTSTHKIHIELSDVNNNVSAVDFKLKYDAALNKNYSIDSSAFVCSPGEENNIQTEDAIIHFDENAFYDALALPVTETAATSLKQVSPTIHIGSHLIPVHDAYDISVKMSKDVSDSIKNKIVMELQSGSSNYVEKGDWKNNYMHASFYDLGNARLLIDTIAPVIMTVGWKEGSLFNATKKLIIKCTDDLSRIENFRAELDGNWLMFAKKNDYFIYTFDEHCANGDHTLTVTAKDVAGNSTTQTFNFTKE